MPLTFLGALTDGVAIAWAVSEQLIGMGTYTVFATHFSPLGELADLYPNCKQWHFGAEADASGLLYTHKLVPNAPTAVHYGILLASAVSYILPSQQKLSKL